MGKQSQSPTANVRQKNLQQQHRDPYVSSLNCSSFALSSDDLCGPHVANSHSLTVTCCCRINRMQGAWAYLLLHCPHPHPDPHLHPCKQGILSQHVQCNSCQNNCLPFLAPCQDLEAECRWFSPVAVETWALTCWGWRRWAVWGSPGWAVRSGPLPPDTHVVCTLSVPLSERHRHTCCVYSLCSPIWKTQTHMLHVLPLFPYLKDTDAHAACTPSVPLSERHTHTYWVHLSYPLSKSHR